jgi:hypothetical protein
MPHAVRGSTLELRRKGRMDREVAMTVSAASDYPLLNAFWTMLIFFAWVIWIWMVITIFMDIFRRQDIGGWAKAGWTVFVLVLPFVGVIVYLISQSRAMGERRMREAADAQASFDSYVKSVASTNGHGAAEIGRAKELLDNGAITVDEYEELKRKVLTS